ncbi:hypothetical protein ACFL0V_02580 [Nanoarchaeota archaeon]
MIAGIIGLLLITAAILLKKREYQTTLFIIGGILLEIYSILINDIIFICLQFIFTAAAIYDLARIKKLIG